jgi:hypothetical protein
MVQSYLPRIRKSDTGWDELKGQWTIMNIYEA